MFALFCLLFFPIFIKGNPRDRKPSDKPVEGVSGFFVEDGQVFIHDQQYYENPDSKKVIVFVHGSGQHSGNYDHVKDEFLKRGLNFHSYDSRYHGKSTGGDRNKDLTDFDVMAQDLVEIVTNRIPDFVEEVYLIGHSMGTVTLLLSDVLYDLRVSNPKVKGLILTGNACEVTINWFTVQMAKLMNLILPEMVVVRNNLNGITDNPVFIEMMENDPLLDVYEHSARFGSVFLKAVEKITEGLNKVTLPIMLIHGTSDQITPPSAVDFVYNGASSEVKKVVLYAKMQHEVFFDESYQKVVKDIVMWIDQDVNSK